MDGRYPSTPELGGVANRTAPPPVGTVEDVGASTMVDSAGVHVRLTGWESIFGFARHVRIRADEVVSAEELDWDGVRTHYGVRLWTAYLLRRRAGGWFMITRGRQHLVFCWLHRGEPALVIRTRRRRPGQVAVAASTVTYGEGSEWFTQRLVTPRVTR